MNEQSDPVCKDPDLFAVVNDAYNHIFKTILAQTNHKKQRLNSKILLFYIAFCFVRFDGISTIVGDILLNSFYSYCDGKFTKIPKRDFIFRPCEDGTDWHLISCRISPRSESFLGHVGTGILCEG